MREIVIRYYRNDKLSRHEVEGEAMKVGSGFPPYLLNKEGQVQYLSSSIWRETFDTDLSFEDVEERVKAKYHEILRPHINFKEVRIGEWY
jgi:hypothetical protein